MALLGVVKESIYRNLIYSLGMVKLKGRVLYLLLPGTLCLFLYQYILVSSHHKSFIIDPMNRQQDDPVLIEYIQSKIEKGATETTVQRDKISMMGQVNQVQDVINYFKNMKGGYFLESGAFDGVYLSNTIYLETYLGWTGLLVEPNLLAYRNLRSNNRTAKSINACLSLHRSSEEVMFDAADVVGAIHNSDEAYLRDWVPAEKRSKYKLQCYPIFSILEAIGNPRVDFWSLDVEGSEEPVLRTIPWEKTNIQSILVEVEHSNETEVISLLLAAGFRIQQRFGRQDIFFVRS